jgi:hypothetical protein
LIGGAILKIFSVFTSIATKLFFKLLTSTK